jgi:AcrR family transcriptional regulator
VTEETGEGRSGGRISRRAEYAETTRRAIVDEARRLFSRQGYFATTVDDIAVAARVARATVYAVAGGKQGLLDTLIDEWTTAPVVAETLGRIEKLTDPVDILRAIASLTRTMRQDYGDIMRVVLATAPHDPTAAEGLKTATSRYRAGTSAVAAHLGKLGALREGVDTQEALDIMWFYFGYSGFFTLVDDNGWSYPRAEQWLLTMAREALL